MPPTARQRQMTPLLDSRQMARVIRRMAGEIVEKNSRVEDLILVGIRTRGVPLAEALAIEIKAMENVDLPIGILDITLYRDDLSTIGPGPVVRETHLPLPVEDKVLVLCDDVLYSGRTIRAALDALVDFGRPRAVQLAILIDRVDQRELPIQADVVGREVGTTQEQTVRVRFESTDGVSEVEVVAR